jgi:hypothetical protein
METKNTSIANILPLVFKAVGLAMGVASVVLSAMGVADMDTLVTPFFILTSMVHPPDTNSNNN